MQLRIHIQPCPLHRQLQQFVTLVSVLGIIASARSITGLVTNPAVLGSVTTATSLIQTFTRSTIQRRHPQQQSINGNS